VPEDVGFATKAEIALMQLQQLLAEGAPRHCVLADAGYGVEAAFRRRLEQMGLPYVVGIISVVSVWPPGSSRCRRSAPAVGAAAEPAAAHGTASITRRCYG
jgi:SRSO17 transposase